MKSHWQQEMKKYNSGRSFIAVVVAWLRGLCDRLASHQPEFASGKKMSVGRKNLRTVKMYRVQKRVHCMKL